MNAKISHFFKIKASLLFLSTFCLLNFNAIFSRNSGWQFNLSIILADFVISPLRRESLKLWLQKLFSLLSWRIMQYMDGPSYNQSLFVIFESNFHFYPCVFLAGPFHYLTESMLNYNLWILSSEFVITYLK